MDKYIHTANLTLLHKHTVCLMQSLSWNTLVCSHTCDFSFNIHISIKLFTVTFSMAKKVTQHDIQTLGHFKTPKCTKYVPIIIAKLCMLMF